MLFQLCGTCAIEQNLPLEDRKKLAGKIISDQVYKCPSCDIHFGLFNSQYASSQDKMELPFVENNVLEKKEVKEVKQIKKEVKPKTVVQTSLF